MFLPGVAVVVEVLKRNFFECASGWGFELVCSAGEELDWGDRDVCGAEVGSASDSTVACGGAGGVCLVNGLLVGGLLWLEYCGVNFLFGVVSSSDSASVSVSQIIDVQVTRAAASAVTGGRSSPFM